MATQPSAAFPSKVKVLSIAGVGRSGSTLLSKILGQVEGFANLGEPVTYWTYGVVRNGRCGCGQPFRDCPLWRAVSERAFGGLERVTAAHIGHLHHLFEVRDIPRSRVLPLLAQFPPLQKLWQPDPSYLATLDRFYRAIAAETGAKVLVDASKLPTYTYLLSLLPSVELYSLHLIRDPRSVTYSWRTKFEQRMEAAASAYQWLSWNSFYELFGPRLSARYMRTFYEDFTRAPRATVAAIAAFAGELDAALPFTDEHTVILQPDHNLSGNSNRTASGPVQIARNDEWRTRIEPSDRAISTLVTLPLLLRYGYAGERSA